ncbi:HNH endonuclease [Rhodococcus fascians]|nr:HNH endonuclease [Rhodococcus fascians]MBY4398763.1 HNH endonuclease [Rhodococcus fascians]MBY4408133.1 HNH endonuclease [Rhodococcus fascians]MBY4423356.1 HNH endonuclease [Rhodococcus fascians]MBY4461124.1 HNH endonuclease [Rhodococcus fascians]
MSGARHKINPNLMPDEYLIKKIGVRIDLVEKRPPTRKGIGGPQRRRILERDGHACQVCGAAAGMPFVDEPTRKAQMTMGHIIPVSRGGTDEDSNLRTECQRCNDEARNVTQNPSDPDHVFNDAQNIKGGVKEKKTLYSWMQAGRRDTSNMERILTTGHACPTSSALRS